MDYSICHLASQFDALGANRKEIKVKVFGGADVLDVSYLGAGKHTIGEMNCESAIETLQQRGFTVLAFDIRGTVGRKISFHTGTGEVLMRRLMPLTSPSQPPSRI